MASADSNLTNLRPDEKRMSGRMLFVLSVVALIVLSAAGVLIVKAYPGPGDSVPGHIGQSTSPSGYGK